MAKAMESDEEQTAAVLAIIQKAAGRLAEASPENQRTVLQGLVREVRIIKDKQLDIVLVVPDVEAAGKGQLARTHKKRLPYTDVCTVVSFGDLEGT